MNSQGKFESWEYQLFEIVSHPWTWETRCGHSELVSEIRVDFGGRRSKPAHVLSAMQPGPRGLPFAIADLYREWKKIITADEREEFDHQQMAGEENQEGGDREW